MSNKLSHIQKKYKHKYSYDKNSFEVKDHCHYTGTYRGAIHSICNLQHSIPKEIHVVSHSGLTYDYHFIIKDLAEEFEREFNYLGENFENCKTFSVPVKKK